MIDHRAKSDGISPKDCLGDHSIAGAAASRPAIRQSQERRPMPSQPYRAHSPGTKGERQIPNPEWVKKAVEQRERKRSENRGEGKGPLLLLPMYVSPRQDDACRLMMTTPGVGFVVALTFRSAIDDPARFGSMPLRTSCSPR
jgi:hypothetical protein